MTAPRHLWSGDWEDDSAAVAEELAARRTQGKDAADAPTEPVAPRPARPSPADRAAAGLRSARQHLASLDAGERLRKAIAGARPAPRPPQDRPAPRPPQDRPAPRPPQDRPAPRPPADRPAPRPRADRAASRRARRDVALAVSVALMALLSAGVAYGIVSVLSSGGQASATVSGPPWLGIDAVNSPFGSGVIVTDVVPGSPADRAGLVPGDVITQIGSRQIQGPTDVNAAIAGLHPGDHVTIQIEQGLTPFTLQATLAARPAGYP